MTDQHRTEIMHALARRASEASRRSGDTESTEKAKLLLRAGIDARTYKAYLHASRNWAMCPDYHFENLARVVGYTLPDPA